MTPVRPLLAAATVFFLITACSRDNDTNDAPGEGHWILDGQQYNITATERASSRGYFVLTGKESAGSANLLQLYFKALPVSGGNYKVVAFEDDVQLGANEMGIKVRMPSTGTYSSTGIEDNRTWLPCADAAVAVDAGKLEVTIPRMTTIIITSTYLDTVGLEGVVLEK